LLDLARDWQGDRTLLRQMCRAKPYARRGRFSARGTSDDSFRYYPRLARKNVCLGEFALSYGTRQQAIEAAVEFRRLCRLLLSAIEFSEEIDAQAMSAETAKTEGLGGDSPASAVTKGHAPEAPLSTPLPSGSIER